MGEEAVTPSAEYRNQVMNEYIDERENLEADCEKSYADEPMSEVLCRSFPLPQDVLLGRGRPFHTHTGNSAMLEELTKHLKAAALLDDDSPSADHSMKKKPKKKKAWSSIATTVVDQIEGQGGRFLQRTAQGWERVADDVAYRKVRQAIRTVIDQHQSQQQQPKSLFDPICKADTVHASPLDISSDETSSLASGSVMIDCGEEHSSGKRMRISMDTTME